jgi:glycosyltransferase involved in cell wall biosynthesis
LPHFLLPFLKGKKKLSIIHDVYLDNPKFWFKQFGYFKGLIGFFVEYLSLIFDRFFAEKVVVVSESTKEKVLRKFSGIENKVFILRNSLNFSDYYESEKDNYLLFVGRFVSYKRPWDLISVLKFVNKKYPDIYAKFVVTRDFLEQKKIFLDFCDKENVKNFELIYSCSAEKLKEVYSKAKILVHPSVVEGQSIVVLEAVSSVTPVCAYDLPAYKGMLFSGSNSELATVFDVEDLASKTMKILDNYEYYQNNTRKRLEDFSIEKFEALIKEMFGFFR